MCCELVNNDEVQNSGIRKRAGLAGPGRLLVADGSPPEAYRSLQFHKDTLSNRRLQRWGAQDFLVGRR